MRLLLDENFPKVAVDVLSKEGHDVLWIRMYAPGMKNREVLKLAAQQERIVLRLDKDFRQLSSHAIWPGDYGVILVRTHPAVPDKIISLVRKALSLELEWLRHFSVISETAVQMLPLHRR